MIWLKPHTARIAHLITEGTQESLTHAALHCRLAIEQVCYERLRNAHNYISCADLRRWQPKDVVQRLIQDVDPHVADTFTMSISKRPVPSDGPMSREEFEAEEYFEIGTQIGFDAKKLGKMWNSLGSFLHVRVPKTSDDNVDFFGESDVMLPHVEAVLSELRRLEAGTLVSSGAGMQVSFDCPCGSTNRRRSDLLKHGQVVSCINPDCDESWVTHIDEACEFVFVRRTVDLPCHACDETMNFAERAVERLPRLSRMRVLCSTCHAENFYTWVMLHERRSDQRDNEP